MGEISKGEGKTVLFVSHNMGSIMSLCNKGILIDNGSIKTDSDINTAVKSYNSLLENSAGAINYKGNLVNAIQFGKIYVNGLLQDTFIKPDENINIRLKGNISKAFNRVIFIISVFHNGTRVFTLRENDNGKQANAGPFEAEFNIKAGTLRPGVYNLAIGAWGESDDEWIWGLDAAMFSIVEIWSNDIRRPDEGIINGEFLRLK